MVRFDAPVVRFDAPAVRFNALKRGSMHLWCGSFSGKLRKRQSRAQCSGAAFNAAELRVTRYGGSPHIRGMNMREVMPVNK